MAKTSKAPVDLLGPIEHLVVRAALALRDDLAYGMAVYETIRSVYPPISFGSVYTALERLTWKGYLESKLGEPEGVRGGRARKYFKVTRRGKNVLEFTSRVHIASFSLTKFPTSDTSPAAAAREVTKRKNVKSEGAKPMPKGRADITPRRPSCSKTSVHAPKALP